MTEDSDSARLVKKIMVGYQLNSLPASLMQSFELLRAKVARAGFKVDVILEPLSKLPSDIDVLFVPAGLVEAAAETAPEALIVPLTASTAQQPAYDKFVKQLQAGEELFALRTEETPDPVGSRGGPIVYYKGNERIK